MVRLPNPVPSGGQAEPQNIVIDLARTAVVIDMQNDFCSPPCWLSHIGVDVTRPDTDRSASGAASAPARQGCTGALGQLGQPAGPAEPQPVAAPRLQPDRRGRRPGRSPARPGWTAAGAKVLERDSWAAAIVDGLTAAPNDIHVAKYRMSGFWDTELDSILRNLGFDAAVRRGECGPVRAVYAPGRQFPGLRLHSGERLRCHHLAQLLS